MKEPISTAEDTARSASAEVAPLKKRVISGSVWTIAGYGASQVLRLAGNLVFARLLFPEAFGVMALVNIFVQGLTMFSDIGIGPSIIQSKRGEDLAFLNTAWTLQIGRGVALWIVSVIGAGPFAAWYGMPELASLIPVAALSAIIAGFASTKLFTANRRISVARITLIEFVSAAVSIAAMISLCVMTRSVWALVLGGLVGTTTKTVLTHVALKGEHNRITLEREALHELMGFGRWIFVSTVLSFLTGQVDRLMLGKFVSDAQLGVYSLAMQLAALPPSIALTLTGGVLFPLLAHHSRTDSEAYEKALRAARSMILRGAIFTLAGLALLAPVFFRVFYDERYADAAWMTQLLTVPMWIWMLMLSADRAVLAVGDSRTLAFSNALSLVCKIGACFAGFHYLGLTGFILGLAVGNLAGHVPVVLALRRIGVHIVGQDLTHTAAAMAAVGGGVLAQRLLLNRSEGPLTSWSEVGVALVVLVPLGWHAATHARHVMHRR